VLVTAGPTREAIDPVRFISNHSSGKMGVALASAAWRRGANVDLVAGPLSVAVPSGPQLRHVETTEEMAEAVRELVPSADVLIMAAAPSDFRPARVARSKIKKGKDAPSLDLELTPDILRATLAKRRKDAIIVGFALETEDAVLHGKAKLRDKKLDLIVVNDATEQGAGFGVDTNRVTLIDTSGAEEVLPLLSKADVADAILDRVERIADGR
jgi:phosphopantothenoylcysteine decarboxylase/phosphopantothenate--cysteine ligase